MPTKDKNTKKSMERKPAQKTLPAGACVDVFSRYERLDAVYDAG